MRRLSLPERWFLLLLILAGPGVSAADEFFGIPGPTRIDAVSGTGASSGSLGWDYVNSLARDAGGNLFSVSQGQLVQIDPSDLTLIPVVDLDGLGGATGLAFSPMGELFAVARGQTGSDPLYRIDLATGAVTVVGDTRVFGLQGLEFSPSGILYGWSVQSGLVTLDPVTAHGTDVNPSVGASVEIQTLAFDSAGTLFGARDALFEIDTTTGVAAQVGPGGLGDIRGIALIPEPSVPRFLTLGLFVLGYCERAKSRARSSTG